MFVRHPIPRPRDEILLVYPMKTRDESIEKLRDLVDVQLKRFQVNQTLPCERRRGADWQASGADTEAGGSNVLMEPRRDTRTECHHGAEVQNARGEDALYFTEIRTACELLVGRI